MVDLRDSRSYHHLGITGNSHGAIENLRDKFLDEISSALSPFGCELTRIDNLLEQSRLRDLSCSLSPGCAGIRISHLNLLWVRPYPVHLLIVRAFFHFL